MKKCKTCGNKISDEIQICACSGDDFIPIIDQPSKNVTDDKKIEITPLIKEPPPIVKDVNSSFDETIIINKPKRPKPDDKSEVKSRNQCKLISKTGITYAVGDGDIIGRIHIGEEFRSVSRKHAKFHYDKGKWFVEDLDSDNGTFICIHIPDFLVNDTAISKKNIKFIFDQSEWSTDEIDSNNGTYICFKIPSKQLIPIKKNLKLLLADFELTVENI